METHLNPIDSGTGPDLQSRPEVQAQPTRRTAAGNTLSENPAPSATRRARGRPDTRRDSMQLARSARRDAPPPGDAIAVPAPLSDGQRPSRRPADPTVELSVSTSDEASDSRRGLALFFTFVAAVLVMVLAVWLAAAVGQWWILIPVVAVDLIVTTAVLGVLIRMLADGASPAQPDIRSHPPVPDSNATLTATNTPASPDTARLNQPREPGDNADGCFCPFSNHRRRGWIAARIVPADSGPFPRGR